MTLQFDPLSGSMDIFRKLNTTLLSCSGEILSWQIDSIQAFFTRGSQQLKASLADTASAQEPDQWPKMVQNGLRTAIKINRDYLIATTDYQMETLRLLQDLRTELQQTITDAMNEQLVAIDVVASREKRNVKAATLKEKLAA